MNKIAYLFVFILLSSMVYANMAIQHSMISKAYLDDQELTENFSLRLVSCLFPGYEISDSMKDAQEIIYTDNSCTWTASREMGKYCNSTPCAFQIHYKGRLLLDIDNKTVLTNEIDKNENGLGVYNVYIYSNESIRLEFLEPIKSQGYSPWIIIIFLLAILVPIIILLFINAGIEILVAYFYFKNKSMPYKGLLWVFLINIPTFILLTTALIVFRYNFWTIFIGELIVLLIEAGFYKLMIKDNFKWKDALILSIITNLVTFLIGAIFGSALSTMFM